MFFLLLMTCGLSKQGASVHSHDEDVDDGKNEEEEGTNVVQVVNLSLLEFLVEVDSGGVHQNKA